MKILGIDTSSMAASVAVIEDNKFVNIQLTLKKLIHKNLCR